VLHWEGKDVPAGLRSYNLYVRDEANPDWQPWILGATTTEAVFTATAGHTYHFCLRGTDRAGNVELKICPGMLGIWPIEAEAIVSAPPTSRVEPLPAIAPGPMFQVYWSGSPGTTVYDVQVRDLADSIWQDWLRGTTATSDWFNGTANHSYAFRCRVLDSRDPGPPLEPWPWGYDTLTTVPDSPLAMIR